LAGFNHTGSYTNTWTQSFGTHARRRGGYSGMEPGTWTIQRDTFNPEFCAAPAGFAAYDRELDELYFAHPFIFMPSLLAIGIFHRRHMSSFTENSAISMVTMAFLRITADLI
jgi:hypothetical protein